MISKERRRKTYKIIKKRIKQIETFSPTYTHPLLKQPHKLHKKKPFARCRCSHCKPKKRGKYFGDIDYSQIEE